MNNKIHPLSRVVSGLVQHLHELQGMLVQMSDRSYTRQSSHVLTSSIGAHVRHSLDHLRLLMQAMAGICEAPDPQSTNLPRVCYDRRERGTDLESHRTIAIQMIDILVNKLNELPEEHMHLSLEVEHMLDASGEIILLHSTLERELFFVMHHSIHHNALIAVLLREESIIVQQDFGMAPSTLEFQSRS